MKRNYLAFLLISIMVVGCGPTAPTLTPTSPATTPDTSTLETRVAARVFATLTASAPSGTAPPPRSATPTPRSTPASTSAATTGFRKWKVSQVVAAFKQAGLEVADPQPMTKTDFGTAPRVAVEATLFVIPSLCKDCGGRIFSFASQADLDRTQKFYTDASKSSGGTLSWFYVKDNILVQLNSRLPEAKAKQYQSALNTLQ